MIVLEKICQDSILSSWYPSHFRLPHVQVDSCSSFTHMTSLTPLSSHLYFLFSTGMQCFLGMLLCLPGQIWSDYAIHVAVHWVHLLCEDLHFPDFYLDLHMQPLNQSLLFPGGNLKLSYFFLPPCGSVMDTVLWTVYTATLQWPHSAVVFLSVEMSVLMRWYCKLLLMSYSSCCK